MIKKHGKKILAIQILIIISLSTALAIAPKIRRNIEIKEIEVTNLKTIEEVKSPVSKHNTAKTNSKAYLEVQFICQAPLQTEENWEFHEESCEEAALLQTINYERNKTVSKEEANTIILDMIEWQKKNFGGHFDLYALKMQEFIIRYYGLEESQVQITFNATIDDIKDAIKANHPVIVPITGEILNNPYYPYPGYHMLVVTGFTEDRIITNDNGTRHGEDFSYDSKTFEAAMKDTGGDIIIIDLENINKTDHLEISTNGN